MVKTRFTIGFVRMSELYNALAGQSSEHLLAGTRRSTSTQVSLESGG